MSQFKAFMYKIKKVFSATISEIEGRFRSSYAEVFCKKDALKFFAKFTGKHLCPSLFLIKLHA